MYRRMLRFFQDKGTDPATTARLRRIENKLDLILDHLKLEFDQHAMPDEELDEEVRTLADDGKKIEAIKLYRELTGAGLKEAKDAIDEYLGKM